MTKWQFNSQRTCLSSRRRVACSNGLVHQAGSKLGAFPLLGHFIYVLLSVFLVTKGTSVLLTVEDILKIRKWGFLRSKKGETSCGLTGWAEIIYHGSRLSPGDSGYTDNVEGEQRNASRASATDDNTQGNASHSSSYLHLSRHVIFIYDKYIFMGKEAQLR